MGAVFDLDPLKIQILANPGEPPKLSKEMGHVSISHCNDAIAVVWSDKKIGVDIERIDRIFNYEKLAKKYFSETYANNLMRLKRKTILNHWSAIEAAIKWDRGKLSEDIKEWIYFEDRKEILHRKKKINLKINQFNFYQWTISVAVDENEFFNHNIICSNKEF